MFTCILMRHDEAHIQASAVKWLQSEGFFFCAIPNELGGSDAKIRMARHKTLGLRSGAPDLIIFLPAGNIVCLEFKSATGTQSPAQINFQKRLQELDHTYKIVRSLEDVQEALSQWK